MVEKQTMDGSEDKKPRLIHLPSLINFAPIHLLLILQCDQEMLNIFFKKNHGVILILFYLFN